MIVGIDYTKMSMMELHLCQSATTKEIQSRDSHSQILLENTRKQNDSLVAQLEEVEQRKSEAECNQVTLVRVLEEACRSLPDFDIQNEEEPE